MSKDTPENEPLYTPESIETMKRVIAKIPPQRGERAAENLEQLKAAVRRMEREMRGR